VAADLVVRARRAVVGGRETPASVLVEDGRVVAVAPYAEAVDAAQTVDLAEDEVLLPGLVDTHVHVNEPGRTHWEGFASATRAAAAGGVTTIVDMPLNSIPPTTTVAGLEQKRRAARDQAFVDVGFWGGAVSGNLGDLGPLHEAGVFGFKCFLLPSGVDEFPELDAEGLDAAMREVARLDALLVVHAEDETEIAAAPAPGGATYAGFLASRPARAEEVAIARVIEAATRTGARAHVVHLSSAGALPRIREARAAGVRLTVETCPHYLFFSAEEIRDAATEHKCCPPIREAENRDLLWDALADGTVDLVVTDHSPCPPELKHPDTGGTGDFAAAWGGIASLEIGLSVVWTEARRRGHTLADVVRWLAEEPAALVGLETKGRIAPGMAADLCAFAPDASFVVDPARLHHRHPITPYAGRTLTGTVRRTWLRGEPVDPDDLDAAPRGRLLARGDA
jgi:allantoinase